MEEYLKGQSKGFFQYIGFGTKTHGLKVLQHELYDDVNDAYVTQVFSLKRNIQRKYRQVYEKNQKKLDDIYNGYVLEKKAKKEEKKDEDPVKLTLDENLEPIVEEVDKSSITQEDDDYYKYFTGKDQEENFTEHVLMIQRYDKLSKKEIINNYIYLEKEAEHMEKELEKLRQENESLRKEKEELLAKHEK